MNDSPAILLTGFTGVLGKRFAYRLAAMGYDVYCPIRAGSEAQARERFTTVFHALSEFTPGFDASVERRLHPLPGDMRQDGLGLSASVCEELSRRRTVGLWHLAALLDLTESNSQDVYDTNLLGTLRALDLAKKLRIPEIHYFSTFGSSGNLHEGIVREIPGIRPPSFRNTYERTKWEAERHVWQAQIRGEISATIYRPSIVVGDSVLGRYEQFNVFNHPFDIASRLRERLCEKFKIDPRATLNYELRVPGDGNATLNIVPLDFVMETVMKIFSVPTSRGRVYHIVNPNPPSLQLAMDIFKRHAPWEGLRWDIISPDSEYLNPHEKFVARQLGFLAPYLLGEATYDMSNVHAVLAFHGGLPPLNNEVFLEAITNRGLQHGWQEVTVERSAYLAGRRETLESSFVWPEGDGLVVDFSPHHPLGGKPVQAYIYSVADRLLGKAYQVRERLVAGMQAREHAGAGAARDIVLVPFGMGATRRGEGEVNAYVHEEKLCDEIFARMNQVVGFDLRAFAGEPIRGHERLGDVHDDCCWAVADDMMHIIRFFRDVQQTGGTDLAPRLQIMPHSGGIYMAGWLSGVISFDDMALLAHQGAHLISECERLTSIREVDEWFFKQQTPLSAGERRLLDELRRKVDPESRMDCESLAEHFHGRLDMVFSLNAHFLEGLMNEIREKGIQVAPAITLSPNSTVFAGNALEMMKFAELFTGKHRIELKRVPLEVWGSPHHERLRGLSGVTTELLEIYERQGRLRDPVVPFISHDGTRVTTRGQFIATMAGIGDKVCHYEQMIEGALNDGGRHFLLIQSGMFSTAGNLFDGVIHSVARTRVHAGVKVYRPCMTSREPHPASRILKRSEDRRIPGAQDQSLAETIRWYEQQLSEAQSARSGSSQSP